MYPDLLEAFGWGVSLPAYGVLGAVAYLVGLAVVVRVGRRDGIDGKTVVDVTFWVLLAALGGSYLLHVLTNLDVYWDLCVDPDRLVPPTLPCLDHADCPPRLSCLAREAGSRCALEPACLEVFKVWRGGAVFLGGVVAGLGVLVWMLRRRGQPVWPFADALFVGLPLSHAIGRLGCLLAGCCYGAPSDVAWAVTFPRRVVAGADGLARHPTQLYEAAFELALFAGLWVLHRRRRFAGQALLVWLVCYGAGRFALEMLRGDPERRFLVRLPLETLNAWLHVPVDSPTLLSVSQVIGLALLAAGLLAWRPLKRRAAAGPS